MILNSPKRIETRLANFMPKHAVGYNFTVAMLLLAWTCTLAYLSYNFTVEFNARRPILDNHEQRITAIETNLPPPEK